MELKVFPLVQVRERRHFHALSHKEEERFPRAAVVMVTNPLRERKQNIT